MAINWQDVRYRGDAQDVEELASTYRVKDYLDTTFFSRPFSFSRFFNLRACSTLKPPYTFRHR